MGILIKFFKATAILSDVLHLAVWLIWIAICASGILKTTEIDPDFSGWRVMLFYGLPGVIVLLLLFDALRLWFASEQHRMLWLSMLIRTISVVTLIVVVGCLIAPTLHRIYYGNL
ncbi:MAG: hypothetical protein LBM70_08955 [Victivallales bacterium]|jgi:hypothetical protein|nr:hypothetical protein [Victivallales bacterium]